MTCSQNSISLRIYSNEDLNIEDIIYNIIYSVMFGIEFIAISWAYSYWFKQRKYDPKRDKIIGHVYFQSTIYVIIFSIISYVTMIFLPVQYIQDQRYKNLCIFNSIYETAFFLFAKVIPCFIVVYQVSISIGIMQFQLYLSRFLRVVKIIIFIVFVFLCICVGCFIGIISDLYNYYPQEAIFPFEIGVLVCSMIVIGLQILLLLKKESQYGHLLNIDQRVEHKRTLYLSLAFLVGLTLMIAADVIAYVLSQFDINPIYRIICSIIGYAMLITCQVASYFPPKQILYTYEADDELIEIQNESSSF